jgi:hypothetical protein
MRLLARSKALLILVLAGWLGGCVALPIRKSERVAFCFDIIGQGVVPPLPDELLVPLLCETYGWSHPALNRVGFGYGKEVYGQMLRRSGGVTIDTTHWRQEHCTSWPPDTRPESLPRAEYVRLDGAGRETYLQAWRVWSAAQDKIFASVRAKADPRKLQNWRNCRAYFDGLDGSYAYALGCAAILGEDGRTVTLEVRYDSDGWLDSGTRLWRSLEIEGVRCSEHWSAGTKLRTFREQHLVCQRIPGKDVRFRIQLHKLSCETSIPWLAAAE